jgi:hypothetical protein
MDDTVNRLAKELAQAIRAAVAADPTVEACRAKARAGRLRDAPRDRRRSGFANRAKPTAVVKVRRAGAGAVSASGGTAQPNTPAGPIGFSSASNGGAGNLGTNGLAPRRPVARELSASDRLFLKSLRIAPDELPEVKG